MAKSRSKEEIGFGEMFRISGIALLIVLGASLFLLMGQQAQAEADWDGAKTLMLSTEMGARGFVLENINSSASRLTIRGDGGTVLGSIEIPQMSTSHRYFDNRGQSLPSEKQTVIKSRCLRLNVDGVDVGKRGDRQAVVCPMNGGPINWP